MTAIADGSERLDAELGTSRDRPVSIAFADYDRTRPIIDGRVKVKGLDLQATTRRIGDFCRRPVYEEFDAAEMSFSWYVSARSRGEPVIALPIFLLRMPVFAYVYVREDSPFTKPNDLVGRTIGARGYRQTVNLWLRGLFKEFYDLAPEQATWVTSGEEDAGYVVPGQIPIRIDEGSSAMENLKRGVVDAVFATSTPKPFQDGEPWIRRLFPDAQRETQAFFKRTGIMPLTHVLVMNRDLAQREPPVVDGLFKAFVEAQRLANQNCQGDPKCLSVLDSVFVVRQQHAAYGSNPYVHGVSANRTALSAFVRYAHEQGYTSRLLALDELFAPSTLST